MPWAFSVNFVAGHAEAVDVSTCVEDWLYIVRGIIPEPTAHTYHTIAVFRLRNITTWCTSVAFGTCTTDIATVSYGSSFVLATQALFVREITHDTSH